MKNTILRVIIEIVEVPNNLRKGTFYMIIMTP